MEDKVHNRRNCNSIKELFKFNHDIFLAKQLKQIAHKNLFSIFLIDHAWTFRPQTARQQLETYPGLASRMSGLLDIDYSDEYKEEIINQILV